MPRAVKGAGKGSALKRKDRRQAKYNPGPGPGSFKPVGVADAPDGRGGGGKDGGDDKKDKKALGKLSKKRKAEGGGGGGGSGGGAGGGGGGGGGDDGNNKSKFAKKSGGGGGGGKHHSGKDGGGYNNKDASSSYDGKKKAPLSNKHADAPKHIATTRKEQKQANDEKKALQKPNFSLIQEIVGLWERLRVKKISGADKRALVASIFKACKGKVPELSNNHKGSRVIQALLKFGTKEEVASVYSECTPQIAVLAKSLYGHFLVKKLVDSTSKDKLPQLLQHIQGNVRGLAKHPVGSQVLESLYFPAPPAQKLSMQVEFYGSEYALFGAAGDGTGGGVNLHSLVATYCHSFAFVFFSVPSTPSEEALFTEVLYTCRQWWWWWWWCVHTVQTVVGERGLRGLKQRRVKTALTVCVCVRARVRVSE